jgi:hypothetical protein
LKGNFTLSRLADRLTTRPAVVARSFPTKPYHAHCFDCADAPIRLYYVLYGGSFAGTGLVSCFKDRRT